MEELNPQPFTIRGEVAYTFHRLPAKGRIAPSFRLVDMEFKDWSLEDFAGRKKILNIVPSLNVPAWWQSAGQFVDALSGRSGVVVLTISADTPFALARACADLPVPNGTFLSTFRSPEFGMDYGTLIVEHAWMGLQARAVVVLDEHNVVQHSQLVPEAWQEPDCAAALAALG
jgi:thioredoxin-dependent peroxiredoxin